MPALLARGGGSIVYTVSGAAFVGGAESVCKEGIRANAVAPGLVPTDAVRAGMRDEAKARILALGRMKRLGQPEDIAAMVALLLSDEGEWITGQVISADGGATMR